MPKTNTCLQFSCLFVICFTFLCSFDDVLISVCLPDRDEERGDGTRWNAFGRAVKP